MSEITTNAGLVNAALMLLGYDEPISSIGETTKAGQISDIVFETTRNALLRAHPWNFATKYADLAQDAVETALIPDEYLYSTAYTLPTDCLRVRRTSLEALGYVHDYRVVKRFIYCDDTTLKVEYTFKETTVAQYDALFKQLLIYDLAIAMCMPLTQSRTLRADLMQARKELAPEVRTLDAQEGSEVEPVSELSWSAARL
jgi:hypothetical protein